MGKVLVGGAVYMVVMMTMVVYSCLVVASEEDRQMERWMEESRREESRREELRREELCREKEDEREERVHEGTVSVEETESGYSSHPGSPVR